MSNTKPKTKKGSFPSFLLELNRMEKIKTYRNLNSSEKQKMRRLQGQLKALNTEGETKGHLPLNIQDVEKSSNFINNSKTAPKTAAVIESAPQIRNLQKELTMFVPSTVNKKKIQNLSILSKNM